MEWMVMPLRRYFDFKGRSRRKEYWYYILFVVLVSIGLSIVDAVLGLGGAMSGRNVLPTGATGFSAVGALSGGVLASLFSLATFIPSLAVLVRRLHDTNRRGWWALAPMLPYLIGALMLLGGLVSGIGGNPALSFAAGGTMIAGGVLLFAGFIMAIVLLVWLCSNGVPGPNRFGPDPKGAGDTLEEVFR